MSTTSIAGPSPNAQATIEALLVKIRRQTTSTHRISDLLAKAAAEAHDVVEDKPPPGLPTLRPLLLTHVVYHEGDRVGELAALVTLVPLVGNKDPGGIGRA